MTASTTVSDAPSTTTATRVYRVEVRPRPEEADPLGQSLLPAAEGALGRVRAIHTARIYLIEASFGEATLARIAHELLADPVTQTATLSAQAAETDAATVEVHYLPGVMDPAAQSTQSAILEMIGDAAGDIAVRTGFRYDFELEPSQPASSDEALTQFAQRHLANPVIQEIHTRPQTPERFVHGRTYEFELIHVPIRELDDEGLAKLSRQGHLFLSLEEMRTIRDHYRNQPDGREPTDIELETLAQTWSEHCVHKTLKSTIHYSHSGVGMADGGLTDEVRDLDFRDRPGHTLNADGSVTIDNLLKSTIAAATFELMEDPAIGEWCVSVFEDNAGIVKFDEADGVCIKVETHNHPSAIEPYGGAATGIGGCIRDIMGTGLSARPIANTNVFCVAQPNGGWRIADSGLEEASDVVSPSAIPHPTSAMLPPGVIHPRRVLEQVVAGVRDYGNRMGIPTVNGAVYFHDDFLGNPLVFAGCVGLIPLDKCFGQARPGDRIIVLGGATGRDGIHGATFSSAELTDTHATEFSHAVQIGNAITQKKTLDVILQARDDANGCLFSAITDCGAGGLSSAVGEMGEKVGAFVELEKAPLKYQGLSYTEIWISEAQERMVLAVPPENVEALRAMCEAQDVSFCDLGHFGEGARGEGRGGEEDTSPFVRGLAQNRREDSDQDQGGEPQLVLTYQGVEVGRLSMRFLHEGLPKVTREAVHRPEPTVHSPKSIVQSPGQWTLDDGLRTLLSHPNIASKHWIIRQYDHEVQGGSVVKPLVGPGGDGPSDASVVRPKLSSQRGVALACGMAPHLSEKATAEGRADDGDSYWASLAAIDEAVRNVVCVGADPERIALLDNFCWPGCDDPQQLGSLVRAAEACYDGAMAYRAPFISGKDSLNNQFTTADDRVITIPPTLLITALGIVSDVTTCVTMDAKKPGNVLLMVGETDTRMGGSHFAQCEAACAAASGACVTALDLRIPHVDLRQGPANARAVASLIQRGLVASAHDCSDGGLLVAAAEMAFAGRVGLDMDFTNLPVSSLQAAAPSLSVPSPDPSRREGGQEEEGRCAAPAKHEVVAFAETPSRYLLDIASDKVAAAEDVLRDAGVAFGRIGTFAAHDRLTLSSAQPVTDAKPQAAGSLLDASLDELRDAWRKPLDW